MNSKLKKLQDQAQDLEIQIKKTEDLFFTISNKPKIYTAAEKTHLNDLMEQERNILLLLGHESGDITMLMNSKLGELNKELRHSKRKLKYLSEEDEEINRIKQDKEEFYSKKEQKMEKCQMIKTQLVGMNLDCRNMKHEIKKLYRFFRASIADIKQKVHDTINTMQDEFENEFFSLLKQKNQLAEVLKEKEKANQKINNRLKIQRTLRYTWFPDHDLVAKQYIEIGVSVNKVFKKYSQRLDNLTSTFMQQTMPFERKCDILKSKMENLQSRLFVSNKIRAAMLLRSLFQDAFINYTFMNIVHKTHKELKDSTKSKFIELEKGKESINKKINKTEMDEHEIRTKIENLEIEIKEMKSKHTITVNDTEEQYNDEKEALLAEIQELEDLLR